MMDPDNQVTYEVMAALFGVYALLYAWGRYRKKPLFLRPEMTLTGIGTIFWCVCNIMKSVEVAHSIFRRGPSGIFGMIGAILFIIGGIGTMRNSWRNRANRKGTIAKPIP